MTLRIGFKERLTREIFCDHLHFVESVKKFSQTFMFWFESKCEFPFKISICLLKLLTAFKRVTHFAPLHCIKKSTAEPFEFNVADI